MKTVTFISALLLASATLQAQPKAEGYQFTTVVNQKVTPVKNQAATGTCWCFATTSFIEAELLRQGKGEFDLSEMYIVRQKYMNQLNDNYLRHGNGNISQGSISPSWFTAFTQVGIVPEEVYSGINYNSPTHNHKELASYMEAIAGKAVQMRQRSPEYDKLIKNLFDIYMGELPEKFTYKGKEYTPQSYAKSLGLNPDDYVSLTSFTHYPFYSKFIIEVQDNWRWAESYNLPLDEFMEVMDQAVRNGYSFAWGADVSEKGFSRQGIATVPDTKAAADKTGSDAARWTGTNGKGVTPADAKGEKVITQEMRQLGYDNWETTDDHGMIIYGLAKDQNGKEYFMMKNSWGVYGPYKGLWYVSKPYVAYKTMNILINKHAIPAKIAKKLGLK